MAYRCHISREEENQRHLLNCSTTRHAVTALQNWPMSMHTRIWEPPRVTMFQRFNHSKPTGAGGRMSTSQASHSTNSSCPAATPSPVSCVASRLSVSDALERPRTSRPAPRFSLHMRWTGRTFARSTGEPPRDTGTTSSHSHDSGSRTRRPSPLTTHALDTSIGWPHSAHGSPAAARARHDAIAALRAFHPPTE